MSTSFYSSITEQAVKIVNSAFRSIAESEGKQITATFDLEALATYARSPDCCIRFSIADVRVLKNVQWYNLGDFNGLTVGKASRNGCLSINKRWSTLMKWSYWIAKVIQERLL